MYLVVNHLSFLRIRHSKNKNKKKNTVIIISMYIKEQILSQAVNFTLQVRLQNPSTKPLVYQVLLAGRDAGDFQLPMGDIIQVSFDLRMKFWRKVVCQGPIFLLLGNFIKIKKKERIPCLLVKCIKYALV